jgi:hypothetical protein
MVQEPQKTKRVYVYEKHSFGFGTYTFVAPLDCEVVDIHWQNEVPTLIIRYEAEQVVLKDG